MEALESISSAIGIALADSGFVGGADGFVGFGDEAAVVAVEGQEPAALVDRGEGVGGIGVGVGDAGAFGFAFFVFGLGRLVVLMSSAGSSGSERE